MKFILLIIILINWQYSNMLHGKPLYIASSTPVEMILKEITGNKADIITLLPPGSSPHTYLPKPSQAYKTNKANAVFYISKNLDGWASNMNSKIKYELMDFLPKSMVLYYTEVHNHENGESHSKESGHDYIDPHFWTDPVAVKKLVPLITKIIVDNDKKNENYYRLNAKKFENKLDSINNIIMKLLNNCKAESVFLFHPSFRYFLKRYELKYAGSIVLSPGKEPTSKYIMGVVKELKKNKVKALFNEPQIPDNSIKAIAEITGLKVFTLDPNGGVKGRDNYFDLILYNAQIFKKALK